MEIHQIKTTLEITQVAAQLGIKINSKTKRALCPFHLDKTPSLQFSKEKQICTCTGLIGKRKIMKLKKKVVVEFL